MPSVYSNSLLCPAHLKEKYHLVVKKSGIENAGTGTVHDARNQGGGKFLGFLGVRALNADIWHDRDP